jgi:hypothetical protein
MTTSGSHSWTNSRQRSSILASSWNSSTWVPTMCEQVLRVKTLRMKGCSSPCRVTMLAIWMTGSISASGKIPLRPAHSRSKLRMRRGAILPQSPSAGWERMASTLHGVGLVM